MKAARKHELGQNAVFRIIAGNAQALGCREEQEDSFAFSSFSDAEFIRHGGVLALMADGMGGLAKGHEASQAAVTSFLRTYLTKDLQETIPQAMSRALIAANSAVHDLSVQMNLPGRVGTTLVAAVVKEDRFYWLSVGDSRIYLWRSGILNQVSHDHIFADELEKQVARGYISREDADTNPDRHALTSYLGMPSLRQVDYSEIPVKIQISDRIMLCSDGLYGMLDNTEMASLLAETPPLAAKNLKEKVLAQQYEYQDNLTVLILGVESSHGASKAQRKKRNVGLQTASIFLALLCFVFAGSVWYNSKNEKATVDNKNLLFREQKELGDLIVYELTHSLDRQGNGQSGSQVAKPPEQDKQDNSLKTQDNSPQQEKKKEEPQQTPTSPSPVKVPQKETSVQNKPSANSPESNAAPPGGPTNGSKNTISSPNNQNRNASTN